MLKVPWYLLLMLITRKCERENRPDGPRIHDIKFNLALASENKNENNKSMNEQQKEDYS